MVRVFRRRRLTVAVLLVLGGLVATGLAVRWPGPQPPKPAPAPVAGSVPAAPIAAGAPAHFELTAPLREALAARPLLWGEALRPSQLAGRVVLLTFFASWCVPCRAELEGLRTLAARFPEAQVLAVNHFETFDGLSDTARLAAFLRRMALPFPAIRGSDGLMQTFGGVDRIPTVLVFDRQGRLVWAFRNTGPDSAVPPPEVLASLVAALR